jgi:hypothetical protein
MTQRITLKFRLRDKHAAELNRQARALVAEHMEAAEGFCDPVEGIAVVAAALRQSARDPFANWTDPQGREWVALTAKGHADLNADLMEALDEADSARETQPPHPDPAEEKGAQVTKELVERICRIVFGPKVPRTPQDEELVRTVIRLAAALAGSSPARGEGE